MNKSCGERQCHLAFTVAVCVPMSGVGDLWYSCLRLSFSSWKARLFVRSKIFYSLIGTIVFSMWVLQGVLIRRAGFPLYAALQ